MAITGTISGQLALNDRRTVGLSTNANIAINVQPSAVFTDGVGALQANVLYQATPALSGGVKSVDIYGSVTDSYGSTVNDVRVKAIYVKNKSATYDLVLGNSANAALSPLNATGTITLPPGAFFIAVAPDATGWAITANSADTLLFTGTNVETFDLVVLGGAS